jgi:hypothetical protein
MGVLVGSRVLRDNNNNLVINSAGDYVAEGISSSVTQTLTSLSIQVTLFIQRI